jgi:WD40 repeat protein
MLTFANEHYIFEYEFDEAAAILTFSAPAPIRAVALFETTDSQSVSDDPLRPTSHHALGNGTYIVSGCADLQIMEHSTRYQYRSVVTLQSTSHVSAISYSPTFVAYGDYSGYVYVVRTSNLQWFRSAIPAKGSITSVHATDKFLIATTTAGSWHLFTLEILPDPPDEIGFRDLAHTGAINGSIYDADTQTLITAGSDGLLKSWVVQENTPPSAGADESPSRRVSSAKSANALFMTSSHLALSETRAVDMRDFGEISCICCAARADRWVTAHSDGHLRIWTTDIDSCECVLSISCSICRVTALAVDDPDIILAALDDKTIRCFALANGRQVRTLAGHQAPICAIATCPELDFYVSGSWDNTMKLWTRVDSIGRSSSKVSGPSMISSKRTRNPSVIRRDRYPQPRIPDSKPSTFVYQPISQYEKKKQEIERKRRREKAEYDARLRTPLAKELKSLQKVIWELL